MSNLKAVYKYWDCGRVIGAMLDMARDYADKDECAEETIKQAIQMLKDTVPALDPESLRQKGRWIHDINNLYGCDQCGERETMSPKKLKHYCPNCGADMRGVDDG